MFHSTRIGMMALLAFVVAGTWTLYRLWYFVPNPSLDEFATYEAFLDRLSAEGNRVTLATTSSKLVAPTGESWTPVELRPNSPDRAAPPEEFVNFCGNICAHDFMKKNLRQWTLKPTEGMPVQFSGISVQANAPSTARRRVVSVTRTGFDLLHRRAVFSYSFDCGIENGGILCVQMGNVFLEKIAGKWLVSRYSGLTL